jgi:hypothetical protein
MNINISYLKTTVAFPSNQSNEFLAIIAINDVLPLPD